MTVDQSFPDLAPNGALSLPLLPRRWAQCRTGIGWTVFAVTLLAPFLVAAADFGPNPIVPSPVDQELPIQARSTLARACWQCHGPKKQEGQLRLDSHTAILTGGESGPAVVAGDPDSSLLIEAIEHTSLEMPPSGKLESDRIDLLRRWVAEGAAWPTDPLSEDELAALQTSISDADRQFWSFRPLTEPAVPDTREFAENTDPPTVSLNPIDAFIHQRLAQEGLQPAPPADRRTWIRRLTYDLIGLPPTAAEVEAFVNDSAPDAYERLVDRLLADPRYGERWAQHWLDLVRYAESDGYRQDAYRPHIWRYRDYVVDSFNADKPFARFVMEQLAGDEWAPEDPEVLVATGLLRLWPYEYNQRNVRKQWSDILNDLTDVTGEVFLGLSVGCARCHDHKFDPIRQEDYYRLQAFFTPILPRDDQFLASREEQARYQTELRDWQAKIIDLGQQIDEMERPFRESAAEDAIIKFPEDIQALLRSAPEALAPLDQQLRALAYRQVEEAEANPQNRMSSEQKEQWTELQKAVTELAGNPPRTPPLGMTVSDIGKIAPPTWIPGRNEDLLPAFPLVLGDGATVDPAASQSEDSSTTGRRAALADWLTRPDHPLTWRVIVNRVWQHHFGVGLVATANDFGKLGDRPSHPELLDWLACQFLQGEGRFKPLHRLIVTSATYRQASTQPACQVAREIDPENRLLWRQNLRRLDAEQLRDSLLAVSGELATRTGGPSENPDSTRRSLHTKWQRNRPSPFREAFDGPDTFTSCACRNATNTPTQALLLWNGGWPRDRATKLVDELVPPEKNSEDVPPGASATAAISAENTARWVDAAYHRILQRSPEPEEREAAVRFLDLQVEHLERAGTSSLDWAMQRWPGLEREGVLFPPTETDARLGIPANQLPINHFEAMTIEATIHLRSLDGGARVRTILGDWTGNEQSAGWALGVTGQKSKFLPSSLILQRVAPDAEGQLTYEVIPSGLKIEPNRTYQIGVVLQPTKGGREGVVFAILDREDPTGALRAVFVPHRTIGEIPGNSITIGGRSGGSPHFWDGWIGDVRLSSGAKPPQLLFAPDDIEGKQNEGHGTQLLAHWPLDGTNPLGRDISGNGRDLRTGGSAEREAADRHRLALIDLCHALLCSNEFLYVD